MKETVLAMRKQKVATQEYGKLGNVQIGLLHWKTRTVQGVLALVFTLIVSIVFLAIGDDLSVVEQVGLVLPRWNPLSLEAVKDPNGAAAENGRLALLVQDYFPDHQRITKIGDVEISETTSPDLQWEDDDSPVVEGKPSDSVPPGDPNGLKTTIWVQFPYVRENETELLMGAFRANGSEECHYVRTKTGRIVGLPSFEEAEDLVRLQAGPVHEFQIVSIGDDNVPRCQGGDYYETDLSGPTWKSRPPIMDHHNGTYTVRVQMDPRFAGVFELKVILLFSNFHGLHFHPHRWARVEEVAKFRVEFTVPKDPGSSVPPLPLPKCERKDFVEKKYWSGRWTREQFTPDCEYSRFGRWICVNETLQCQEPWCEGTVGSLESNGWVYSAHCAFKIFKTTEAWKCLDKKWLFFWGDSNHIDTIRNLLNFVLGFNHSVKFLDRRMDQTFYAPGSNNQTSVRITSMFNGHSNVTMNYEGLYSIHNKEFADQCKSYFTGDTAPDFMFMNSGLHDGVFWRDMEKFVIDGVDYTADYWTNIWDNMKARRPDLLYRTTVTTGGNARNQSFNPQKMEWMNHLILDKFTRLNLNRFQIIDGFDYTYPWHYDHLTNDGVHYGRPPAKSKWAGGNMGHRYFVDIMLVHMLLNAIC
ncbi:hypothetical protein Mapa_005304 [Marchantia paleacea]|nr:hypothetical protein Mapa_005304 [Marchantia paleacea]